MENSHSESATKSDTIQVELLPLGTRIQVPRGTPLQDVLFPHGVEFPCGGRGRCKGCKIRVIAGPLPVTPEDRQRLSERELAQGWRLSCQAVAAHDLKIELAQWEAAILSDDTVFEFTPQEGLGIALDLGTTTLVAQLLDLRTGLVMGVRTGLNAQARHGADIMSRIEFALQSDGKAVLESLIRDQVHELILQLLGGVKDAHRSLKSIVMVGNTAMHHLFCGISVEPLSHYPFEPVSPGLQMFEARDLGWNDLGAARVYFLPCVGGFVGSDILAGILATELHKSTEQAALLDLGTNGEIVVGNHELLLCTSTAAGPAFEGARISMGMRAATGAISEVTIDGDTLRCHVLGGGTPRGICGSGLVDAVAAGLDLGLVRHTGRIVNGGSLPLIPPVALNQWDIRELQLAKGAIAAGLRLLCEQFGIQPGGLSHVYLAGAFGNYINHASARRIGLLNLPPDKVRPAGNTALLGAKIALFKLATDRQYADVLQKTRHISLKEDPKFQEAFVDEMTFPS